jgi:hypothetical protein
VHEAAFVGARAGSSEASEEPYRRTPFGLTSDGDFLADVLAEDASEGVDEQAVSAVAKTRVADRPDRPMRTLRWTRRLLMDCTPPILDKSQLLPVELPGVQADDAVD